MFSKQEFDEVAMQDFWTWFRTNQISDILHMNREMGTRLQKLCGGKNSGWYDMGWDLRRNKAYITFWADATKPVRNCFKRLIELAPYDIKENWELRVEN